MRQGIRKLASLLALAAAFAAALAAGGCREMPDERAERLVRAYDDRLVEAYRAADPVRMEAVAGPAEAKKLTGLIGVKADLGLFLDAKVTSFRLARVERPSRGEVHVLTEETWSWADRRIGSGERVGEPSDDRYAMRYVLRRFDGAWKVGEVRFETPPSVGRKGAPAGAPPEVFHGMVTHPATGGGAPAPGATGGKK